jgi:predicted RNase H-like HicB family nuclease
MKTKITARRRNRTNSTIAPAALYLYSVGWFDDDEAYVARVAEFPSLAAHGNSQRDALRSLQRVVEAVVEDLSASKEGIPRPVGYKKG